MVKLESLLKNQLVIKKEIISEMRQLTIVVKKNNTKMKKVKKYMSYLKSEVNRLKAENKALRKKNGNV